MTLEVESLLKNLNINSEDKSVEVWINECNGNNLIYNYRVKWIYCQIILIYLLKKRKYLLLLKVYNKNS